MTARASKLIYLDSEERISGSSSNFSYAIDIPDGAKYDTCCVLSMTIPRSYYLVRSGQNRGILVLAGEGGASPVEHPFEIPPGNYNADNFAEVLLALLNGITTGMPVVPGTFTITFSTITGKYTYSYAGLGTAAIKLEDPSRLGHQMGFDEISVNHFVGGTLQSKNVVNFVSTSTLFLHSDMVDDSTDVLQEVYADNSLPFSNLVYNCRAPGMYAKKLRNNTSSLFNFSLCDEHDKEVDLNGHEILFTLILYRREDLTKTFQKGFEALLRSQADE
jgi:hypothetical protein